MFSPHLVLHFCRGFKARVQVWRGHGMTNDCRIDGRYTQLCASSTDGATGVKQLSALAAPGEKMLLNQEGFSNSPSHKARGGHRSPRAAMEAICLDVTVQQVSPGWKGVSKHLTRQKGEKKNRKYSTTGSISGMSTTHGHSVSTHVTTNPCLPLFQPVFALLCLL